MDYEYRGLAAAIIKQAVTDYKNAVRGIEKLNTAKTELYGFQREKKDIELFMYDEWFVDLCEMVDIDSNYIKKRLEVSHGQNKDIQPQNAANCS